MVKPTGNGKGAKPQTGASATKLRHKGPGRDASSAKAIGTAERHAEWLQLRKEGWSYRRIAAVHGVSHSTVEEAVWKQLREIRQEPARELMSLELEALDDLIDKCLLAVDAGELDVIEQIRKLRADRRKLLGVDAPTKTMDVTPNKAELLDQVRLALREPPEELAKVLAEEGWSRR